MGLQCYPHSRNSFVIKLLTEPLSGDSHPLSLAPATIQRSPMTPTMRNDSFVNPTNNRETSVNQIVPSDQVTSTLLRRFVTVEYSCLQSRLVRREVFYWM
eukprot:scaffold10334_cov54-Cyclotella_meneghiniana.AAC.6